MNQIASISGARAEPHLVEAEQQLLGALLLSDSFLDDCRAAGGEKLFYDPVHAEIFEQINARDKTGQLVSPVALKPWAQAHSGIQELGGPGYLARLAGASVSTSQALTYVEILADLKSKREMLQAFRGAEQDIFEGQMRASEIASRIEGKMIAQDPVSSRKPVSAMLAATDALRDAHSAYMGYDGGAIKTGFDCIDRLVGGLYPSELTVLGGRPSMGKTALALSIALNVARAGKPVTFCSFEMSPKAMMTRAMSEASARHGDATNYFNIRTGKYRESQGEAIKAATSEVAKLPIQFLTSEYREVSSFLAGVKQAHRVMGGLGLVVVDYVQLLTSPARSRYEQITDISLGLKSAAMQLEVPVLALSQLSRAVEQRDDKRPVLSDLRESGQIEQDADAVMFCYRHEYYLERMEPQSGTEKHEIWQQAMNDAHRKIDILIPKNRHGAVGTARMNCNLALNKFWEN